MSNPTDWICIALLVSGLAYLWIIYLVKIVLNDEKVQEKIRRMMRKREEKRRAIADKIKQRKADMNEKNAAYKMAGKSGETDANENPEQS